MIQVAAVLQEFAPMLELPAPDCPECEGAREYAVCPNGHVNPPYCGCIEEYRPCEYCEGTGRARCHACGLQPGERWEAGEEDGEPMFVCASCAGTTP